MATLLATDCALLLALPMTRDDVRVGWARQMDFLVEYAGHGEDEDRVWACYEPYASLMSQVVAEAAASGVSVQRDATLSDLALALGRYRVVTLVAHSRDTSFRAGDVVDPAMIYDRANEIARVAGLDAMPARRTGERGSQDAADLLNGVLAANIRQASGDAIDPSLTTSARHAWTEMRRWDARRAIERLVGSALRGGAAVEFADGFVRLEAIDGALPDVLLSCLDLTVCRSNLLGELLRRRRSTGVILTNVEETTLDFRMALYRQTIRLVKKRGMPYADAAMALRAHLRQVTWKH